MIAARGDTYRRRDDLKKAGFSWDAKESIWKKEGDSVGRYRRMFPDLDVFLFDEKTTRSSGYRRYADGKGIAGFYVCAYCGRITRHPTVDHIMPVNAVYKDAKRERNRKILRLLMRTDNVNDPANLCIACRRCNSRKGKKMGLWTVRGMLGKRKWFVFLRLAFRLALVAAAAAFLLNRLQA